MAHHHEMSLLYDQRPRADPRVIGDSAEPAQPPERSGEDRRRRCLQLRSRLIAGVPPAALAC